MWRSSSAAYHSMGEIDHIIQVKNKKKAHNLQIHLVLWHNMYKTL